MTRREIVKAGAGLAAIIAAGKAPAALVRSMLGMRGAMTGGKRLPYDAEVEWIAGSPQRTAYINTGICPTSTMRIEAEISRTGTADGWYFNTESRYIGLTSTNTTGDNFGFGWAPPRINYGGGLSTFWNWFDFPENTKIKFDFQGGKSWINGVAWFDRSAATLTSTTWLALLANHRSSSVIECANSERRIHSFKVLDGDIVLEHLIPVRFTNELGDSEGAMFDKVSEKFFRNAGTGAFPFGPDK